ncbi:putative Serine-threonine protein kinase, plant-type [Hibiscus syriacus]|uniref:Serine-threonine protein kinase, plant-type n=1 Tax=Hibiscus syriacus TaxID=106335 RepID=A0A6A3ARQ9_HIBSY|nr:putative Serine-threonine protein kinase, plant-type [Hibiscus syriacus]
MGNCVTDCKTRDGADVNLSAQIQPPATKDHFAKREHSIAEPSLMDQQTNLGDLNSGKTEENFFDSNPWLESDSEDFFSVNGDSSLSRGSSPKNYKSLKANSPTDTKKQLIELFRESSNEDDDA